MLTVLLLGSLIERRIVMCRKMMYVAVVMTLGLAPMNLVFGADPDLIA